MSPDYRASVSARAQVDEAGKGVQLALGVGAAGAEDDASGAGSLELGEAGAQGLGRAGERHLLGRARINQCVVAVGDVPVVAAMDGQVADWLGHLHDALEPRL